MTGAERYFAERKKSTEYSQAYDRSRTAMTEDLTNRRRNRKFEVEVEMMTDSEATHFLEVLDDLATDWESESANSSVSMGLVDPDIVNRLREPLARALIRWECCEECEPDWPSRADKADFLLDSLSVELAEMKSRSRDEEGP